MYSCEMHKLKICAKEHLLQIGSTHTGWMSRFFKLF